MAVAGFSGAGKTTCLTSLAHELMTDGTGVAYMALETPARRVRAMFSALRLGYNYNFLIDGTYKGQKNWSEIKDRVLRDMESVAGGVYPLHVVEAPRLSADDLPGVMGAAAQAGAKFMILDHIDHLASGQNAYQESRRAVDTLLDVAQDLHLSVLFATQTNNDSVRGNPLLQCYPPTPEMVYMGAHKRFVVSKFLGLYTPARRDATREELQEVKERRAPVSTILEAGVMGLATMKDRFARREGMRDRLTVHNGRVYDIPKDQRQAMYGYDSGGETREQFTR